MTDQGIEFEVKGYGTVEIPADLSELSDAELLDAIEDLAELTGNAEGFYPAMGADLLFRMHSATLRLQAELARRTLGGDE